VQALDPQGDDSENNDLAARAIDGDTGSAWRSEHYDTAQFGGIKKGVGLAVDLGDPVDVSALTLTAPGTGGIVEMRTADSPDYEGSSAVARGRIEGSGKVALTPPKPLHTRYVIVWFTRAPQQSNGEHRVIVDEIDVR
jgi:eukaryotic-like serine/threonine-protein kinase